MKVGFIGCGNMGGALAYAVSRVSYADILLYDKDTDKASALAKEIAAKVAEINEVIEADCIFLGVKPNILPSVLKEISKGLSEKTLLISMAAGVEISSVEKALGRSLPVIRIMPNMPVSVGKGMILYTKNEQVDELMENDFLELLKFAGKLDEIPERLIDAGSAISGCGPAFVYMFIEALADGGVAAGLPRDKAISYAAETLIGSAEVVQNTTKHTGALKDSVCSPGGSTIEGVLTLEDGGFRGVVSEAVIAAYEKTKRLGK